MPLVLVTLLRSTGINLLDIFWIIYVDFVRVNPNDWALEIWLSSFDKFVNSPRTYSPYCVCMSMTFQA